jgi:hypothetical protein
MPSPVANVQQVITIQGVDNASDAIAKAKASLKGLETQAASTATAAVEAGDSFGDSAKGLSGKAAKGLRGLSKFGGEAAGQLKGLGAEAKGLSLVMSALPGTVGLAVTGALALGAALYSVSKNMSESAAKARLLYTPETRKLGEDLQFSADQMGVLNQAINSLGPNAIAPTAQVLQQVVDNAKEMGNDPAEAVKKFIEAWKAGPEAINAVQAELGRLSLRLQSAHDAFASVGLSEADMGMAKAVDKLKDAQEAAVRLAEARANQASVEQEIDRLNRDGLSPRLLEQYRALQASLEVQQSQVAQLEKEVQQRGSALVKAQELKDVETKLGIWKQEQDARAELAGNKAQKSALQLQTIESSRRFIALQMEMIEAARVALGDKEADAKLRTLRLDQVNLDVKQKQIAEQRKADAKSAADAARQAQEGTLAAKLATAKALADRDGVQTAAERLRIISQETALEERKNAAIKNRTQRAADATRIQAEDATKRAAVERDVDTEVLKAKADLSTKSIEVIKARTQAEVDAFRSVGNELAAVNTEIRAGDDEYTAALKTATDERNAIQNSEALTAEVKALRIEAANKRIEELEAQRVATTMQNAAKLREIDEQQQKETLGKLSAAAETVGKATSVVGGKAGTIIGALSKSVSDVTKNWKSFAESGADAISSAGQVAAAFVDGEKQKAAILAIMETAAAVVAFTNPATYVAGVGHAAAAALYAGVAGGAISGTSGGSSGSVGGFAESAGPSLGNAQANAAPSTIVVNFNQPLATRQDIGRAVYGAMRSLDGTGFPAYKGA